MKIKISILIIIVSLVGCTSGFEDLQKNPNLPESINPGLLLPSVIYGAVNTNVTNGRVIGHEIMQYSALNNSFTQVQRFIFTLNNSNSVWNGFYGQVTNLYTIRDMAIELEEPNYEAIALIMKSWVFSVLTDVFNEIPYTEAGRAVENSNFTPVYDTQKTIYEGIFSDLERANDLLDTSSGLNYGGDILFNGNMLLWKKFANSLRLRLLMRASNKADYNAAAKIKEIVDNPSNYPIFESNDEHATYKYSGLLPDVFPFSTEREFDFNGYVASEFMVNTLKDLGDPRLSIYFEPTKLSVDAGSPEFVGLPSGIAAGDAFEFNGGRDGQSLINNSLFLNNPTQEGIILTYAEVQFLLAEAAFRNIIDGDPQEYYEAGVSASMDYWGAEMDDAYLTTGPAAWDGSEEKLFTQKYLALFWCGMEAWFDYRRTGYPTIVPGPENVNDDKVPVRLTYPTIEQSLNEENYSAAVSRIGGDNINVKGWWESN